MDCDYEQGPYVCAVAARHRRELCGRVQVREAQRFRVKVIAHTDVVAVKERVLGQLELALSLQVPQ